MASLPQKPRSSRGSIIIGNGELDGHILSVSPVLGEEAVSVRLMSPIGGRDVTITTAMSEEARGGRGFTIGEIARIKRDAMNALDGPLNRAAFSGKERR